MHDNLHWYRTQHARTLSELRELAAEKPAVATSAGARPAALSETARQLANALDLVDRKFDRLTALTRKP